MEVLCLIIIVVVAVVAAAAVVVVIIIIIIHGIVTLLNFTGEESPQLVTRSPFVRQALPLI